MRFISVLVACMVTATTCVITAQAHTLREGTWEGTTVLPDGSAHRTDFVVAIEDGELAITYDSVQGPVPLTDISLDGDSLSYRSVQ